MIEKRSAAPGPVVPVLAYEHVGKAIEWVCETFGFIEHFRFGAGREAGWRTTRRGWRLHLPNSRTGWPVVRMG